ncbi:S16 family serine protease [Paenibacillus pasadenensis]|uniref:S16 family serine protease n=1 Tax=Paenibacillus pasadenensis TaxID=217090 RepID=UPI000404C2E5|nr:S16 family serine protease [Paenibacillus pasadenensis]
MREKRTGLAPRASIRCWLPALALAGFVAAAALPRPYYVQTAGFARNAAPLIQVGAAMEGREAEAAAAATGPAWLYTAVKLERASLLEAAYAELMGRGDALSVRSVLGGASEEAYRIRMEEAMRQALLLAARAAADEAKREVVEAEGEAGTSEREAEKAGSQPSGLRLADGGREPLWLGAAAAGGPSAGLMAALSLYDRLTPDAELLGGRRIAGTGTIDAAGRIGAVGGVARKAQAAAEAGAGLFVAPKAEAGEAEKAARRAGGRMRVVGADTLAEAVALLQPRP